jgi:hypothetical protein
MKNILMLVGGTVQSVNLILPTLSVRPGDRVKYLSRKGRLCNAEIVGRGPSGEFFLQRRKQREMFSRPQVYPR